MAKGRIEQEIALKVTGLDDVKDIDQKIDALTKKKAKIQLDADTGDTDKKIAKIDDQIDALQKRKAAITVTADTDAAKRDIDAVFDMVDKLGKSSARIVLADNAKDIKREIGDLLIDLDQLDRNDPKVDITISRINELEGQLERIETKKRELGSRPVDIKISASGDAKGDLDRVADQARALDGKSVDVKVNASGIDDITDKLGSLPGKLGEIGEILGPLAAGGPIVAGVAASAGLLFEAANSAADLAVEAKTYATLTGASVEDASRLLTVLKQTGLEYGDIADITVQVNGALQQSPELAGRLGINLNDGKDAAARLLEVIELNEDGLINMADASALFGEEGIRQMAKVKATVEDITRAILDLPDDAIVTEGDVAKALELKKEMAQTALQAQALAAQFGQAVIPLMTEALGLAQGIKSTFENINVQLPDFGGIDTGTIAENLLPPLQIWTRVHQIEDAWNSVFGSTEKINASVGDLSDKTDAAKAAAEAHATAIDGVATAAQNVVKQIKPLSDMPATWNAAENAVKRMREGLQPTADQLQAVLVLTQQYGMTTEQVFTTAGTSVDAAADHVSALNKAYQDAATDTYAESQERAADAIEAVNSVLEDQADALNAQVDAATAAADSQIDANDAFANFGVVLKDNKATANDVRDAAIDLAKATAQVADDQAAAAGQVQTTTGHLDAQNGALLSTAAAAKGPARSGILDYVGAVNQIPPEKMTEIQAAINRGDLAEAQRLLNEASATRAAAIIADADTAAANRELDLVAARERTAMIKVKLDPNYGAALGPLTRFGIHAEGGTVGGIGGVAGEAGPEFVKSPNQPEQLVLGPTLVPPGSKVTSVRRTRAILSRSAARSTSTSTANVAMSVPLVVNVNAAVIGSRYEVAKAVGQGTRDLRRLIGNRGTAA